jgi:hypothetical protein
MLQLLESMKLMIQVDDDSFSINDHVGGALMLETLNCGSLMRKRMILLQQGPKM